MFSLAGYDGSDVSITENLGFDRSGSNKVVRSRYMSQPEVIKLYPVTFCAVASNCSFFLLWRCELGHYRVVSDITNNIKMLNINQTGYFPFGIPAVTQQDQLPVFPYDGTRLEHKFTGNVQLV